MFPVGSKLHSDVINPNQNELSYTELSIKKNGKKETLRFVAHELHKLADGNLLEQLRKTHEPGEPVYRLMPNWYHLTAILSSPSKTVKGYDLPINTLWVVSPDSTIFKVDFFAIFAPETEKREWAQLSKSVFETIKFKDKRINRKPHSETVTLYDDKFYFNTLADYVIGSVQGIDSRDLSVHKLSAFSDTSKFELYIYSGQYPGNTFRQYEFEPQSAKVEDGVLFGKPTKWLLFDDDRRHIHIKEQQLPRNLDSLRMNDDTFDGIKHLVIVSSTRQGVTELSKFAETIRLKEKPKNSAK